LANEIIFNALNSNQSSGFIESYKDGAKFAKTALLKDQNKSMVALQLYYDDLEVL
jgi:hypothetical protein